MSDKALPELRDGDIVLYRGGGLTGRVIGAVCATPYTHCGMIRSDGATPLLMEFYGLANGRETVFADVHPGCAFEIYRLAGDDRAIPLVAAQVMRNYKGLPYRWETIGALVLTRLPLIRLVVWGSWLGDDATAVVRSKGFICSTAVARAYEVAGLDLVPNRNPNLVDPGDIARCALLTRIF